MRLDSLDKRSLAVGNRGRTSRMSQVPVSTRVQKRTQDRQGREVLRAKSLESMGLDSLDKRPLAVGNRGRTSRTLQVPASTRVQKRTRDRQGREVLRAKSLENARLAVGNRGRRSRTSQVPASTRVQGRTQDRQGREVLRAKSLENVRLDSLEKRQLAVDNRGRRARTSQRRPGFKGGLRIDRASLLVRAKSRGNETRKTRMRRDGLRERWKDRAFDRTDSSTGSAVLDYAPQSDSELDLSIFSSLLVVALSGKVKRFHFVSLM